MMKMRNLNLTAAIDNTKQFYFMQYEMENLNFRLRIFAVYLFLVFIQQTFCPEWRSALSVYGALL